MPRLLDLAFVGRLRLVNGAVREVLPGVDLCPAFSMPTYGSQYVVVRDAAGGPWCCPGDVVLSYANFEGVDRSGQYVPIGEATGSQKRQIEVFDEIVTLVGGDASRVIPVHDADAYERGAVSVPSPFVRPGG